jgi:predicted alpha/beta-hydrolase family hydrolase
VPCLFVSGERDPFGSPAELEAAAESIPGSVSFVWLTGGHDPKRQDDAIASSVVDWMTALA